MHNQLIARVVNANKKRKIMLNILIIILYLLGSEKICQYYANREKQSKILIRHRIATGLTTINFLSFILFFLLIIIKWPVLKKINPIEQNNIILSVFVIFSVAALSRLAVWILQKIPNIYIYSIISILFWIMTGYLFIYWNEWSPKSLEMLNCQ